MEDQITDDIKKNANENKSDEVNDWLLQVKQANMDEMADKTNLLLSQNLQHMKRHARMGVQMGKMRKFNATECVHKAHIK